MTRDHNIASHLAEAARHTPDRAAIAVVRGRHPDGTLSYESLSYAELERESEQLARGLRDCGIGPGTRTVLMVRPGLDFFSLVFGLFRAGAVLVAVDPGMGWRNLGRCLAEAEPTAFIGETRAHAARALLRWGARTIRINVTTGRTFPGGMIGLARLRRRGAEAGALPEVRADETAAILFTSGSTGAPKGVVYTHGNFEAQIHALRELYSIRPGETDISTFPLFALFGPALGMKSVIPRMDFTRPGRVRPGEILDAVHEFGATNMFGSPALLDRVSSASAARGLRLPTLNRILSAGAPVAARILERTASLLDERAQLFTPYGATEALPVSSIGSHEVLSETRALSARGAGVCVGRPAPGIEIRIIRIVEDAIETWDAALESGTGEIGEIAVRGPQVTAAYYNRPEATRRAKIGTRDGGFLHRMGDAGYFDAQGRLWFCGRVSQRVVTREHTYYTVCCEGVFNAHPAVRRTALVGVPDGAGIRPVLCVETFEHATRGVRLRLRPELLKLGAACEITRPVTDILFHRGFPVDIRHNAKIGRERLARWAARRLE